LIQVQAASRSAVAGTKSCHIDSQGKPSPGIGAIDHLPLIGESSASSWLVTKEGQVTSRAAWPSRNTWCASSKDIAVPFSGRCAQSAAMSSAAAVAAAASSA
jgi:hypothetical protein